MRVWGSQHKEDVQLLEWVQRRATTQDQSTYIRKSCLPCFLSFVFLCLNYLLLKQEKQRPLISALLQKVQEIEISVESKTLEVTCYELKRKHLGFSALLSGFITPTALDSKEERREVLAVLISPTIFNFVSDFNYISSHKLVLPLFYF